MKVFYFEVMFLYLVSLYPHEDSEIITWFIPVDSYLFDEDWKSRQEELEDLSGNGQDKTASIIYCLFLVDENKNQVWEQKKSWFYFRPSLSFLFCLEKQCVLFSRVVFKPIGTIRIEK